MTQSANELPGAVNAIREAVAKALYGVQLDAARKALADLEVDYVRIGETLAEVRDCGDDRTAAVALFALVDDLMIALMQRNLAKDVRGGTNALFGGHGMLSTASSRLTLCSALGWLSRTTVSELDLLRKIRNEFAHKVRVRRLTDDPVAGWLSSMEPHEREFHRAAGAAKQLEASVEVRPVEEFTPRQRLVTRGAWLVKRICFELPALPVARLHQVDPGHVYKEFDEMPPPMQEVQRAIISSVWPIIVSNHQ